MRKVLFAEVDKCAGCKACELVCSMYHFGEYNPKKSFIRVLRNKEMNVNIPVLRIGCDLCNGKEKCVEFCIRGVLRFSNLKESIVARKQIKIGILPVPIVKSF